MWIFKNVVWNSLILRVFEACDLPIYDPHAFRGSKHSWYCFNQYDDFACRYVLQYAHLEDYQSVQPDLLCYGGRLDHASLDFQCAFARKENYLEATKVPYHYFQGNPLIIGAGTDTAFSVILKS